MLQYFSKRKGQKGFTLIELLVVIAIIGILATIVLVSLGSARIKARDARRQSDLVSLRAALEMYYDDQQEYPPQDCVVAPVADATGAGCDATFYVTIPVPGGMVVDLQGAGYLPAGGPYDPKDTDSNNDDADGVDQWYGYDVSTDGESYQLRYYHEGDALEKTLP